VAEGAFSYFFGTSKIEKFLENLQKCGQISYTLKKVGNNYIVDIQFVSCK